MMGDRPVCHLVEVAMPAADVEAARLFASTMDMDATWNDPAVPTDGIVLVLCTDRFAAGEFKPTGERLDARGWLPMPMIIACAPK